MRKPRVVCSSRTEQQSFTSSHEERLRNVIEPLRAYSSNMNDPKRPPTEKTPSFTPREHWTAVEASSVLVLYAQHEVDVFFLIKAN